jgi:hypothetical protein
LVSDAVAPIVFHLILMSVQDETNRACRGDGGSERGRLVRVLSGITGDTRTSRPRSDAAQGWRRNPSRN